MLPPDLTKLALELYKYPNLTYLDLSLDIAPYTEEGEVSRKPRVDNRAAIGFRRNYTGVGSKGMEALSVWLTTTTVLKKLSLRGGMIRDEGAVVFERCIQLNPDLAESLCYIE